MPNKDINRIAIIGGGISGLSTAWFLHQKGVHVRLFEGNERVGGVIDTDRGERFTVERGPNSTLQRPGREEDGLGRLIAGIGLEDRAAEAAKAAKKRFVMRGGRLVALPGSPPGMITTSLFSWRAKLRLLGEPFVGRAEEEETIAQFVERRLGREFLDYAVEPFVSGVYAGDPGNLSVRAAVPRVYALEERFGSLIGGAIKMGKAAEKSGAPAGRLVSFDKGMAVLPETIAAGLPDGTIRTGCRVSGLEQVEGGWRVDWESAGEKGSEKADRVVLAVPAPIAADLVEPLSAPAAGILRGIPYAPILSVAVAYGRDQVGHALDGFGFLVPRREGLRILGGLFSSTLFAGRAPDGKVLLTVFIGGATDPAAIDLDAKQAAELVHGELAPLLAITGEPTVVGQSRHKGAIPQYTMGHLERMAELDGLLSAFPGLHARASWQGGISVSDCVRNGEIMAHSLVEPGAGT